MKMCDLENINLKKVLALIICLYFYLFNSCFAYQKYDDFTVYSQYVHDRIKENWVCQVPFKGPMVGIKIYLNCNGEIENIQIIRSAGYLADSTTFAIIKSLSPFKSFPESVNLKEADFTFFFSQTDMY